MEQVKIKNYLYYMDEKNHKEYKFFKNNFNFYSLEIFFLI